MDSEKLDLAVDLLLGIHAFKSQREAVRLDIDDACLRFNESEAWQENFPSLASAARQVEALDVACRGIVLGWKGGDLPALGLALRQALIPFLVTSPYGVHNILEGSVPSLDGKRYVPVGGQICETATGRKTLLSIALDELEKGGPLSPLGYWFICDLMGIAQAGWTRLHMSGKTGKGAGGTPLYPSWASHNMVVHCLSIWERYAPGKASRTPGSPFIAFVSLVFELATGDEPQDHGRVIRTVFRKWRARTRPTKVGRPAKPQE